MTKTHAAQLAKAYADSQPAGLYVRLVEMSTRYIVHAHSWANHTKTKKTFRFSSELGAQA